MSSEDFDGQSGSDFWQGFREGAGLKTPVTEPKRSQKPKRPLCPRNLAHRYTFDGNALGATYSSASALDGVTPMLIFGIAAEQRQSIAHGASRGKDAEHLQAPDGAKELHYGEREEIVRVR